MKKIFELKWFRIIVFIIISLTTSFLFRIYFVNSSENVQYNLLVGLLSASGPFLVGLLLNYKIKAKITFFGCFNWKLLFIILIPSLIFGVFGSKMILINSHVSGVILGLYITIYSIFEETGWRGYLQSEFENIKPIKKYIIVGTFWYFWHLTFLGETNFINEFVTYLILTASSIGIGLMADRTKSIFYSSCFHLIGNVCFYSSLLISFVDIQTRIVTSLILITCLIIVFKNKKNNGYLVK